MLSVSYGSNITELKKFRKNREPWKTCVDPSMIIETGIIM